jgi:hypothetical protein
MSRLAPLALAAALALSTGCFVFDEIDKGQEIMKQHSGSRAKPASADADTAAAEEADEDAPGVFARIQAFWEKSREETEPERSPDDEIITCELGDDTTFTYESDCLSRGGRIR